MVAPQASCALPPDQQESLLSTPSKDPTASKGHQLHDKTPFWEWIKFGAGRGSYVPHGTIHATHASAKTLQYSNSYGYVYDSPNKLIQNNQDAFRYRQDPKQPIKPMSFWDKTKAKWTMIVTRLHETNKIATFRFLSLSSIFLLLSYFISFFLIFLFYPK